MILNVEIISTTVYRKVTDAGIYINWKSFAPKTWKSGNLRTLARHAYDVFSNDYIFGCELQHLNKVFHKQNDYPVWLINKVLK